MIDTAEPQISHPGVTLRAVIIGLLLIPVNMLFIMANVLYYWSTIPTLVSLFFNVVISLRVCPEINYLIYVFPCCWGEWCSSIPRAMHLAPD